MMDVIVLFQDTAIVLTVCKFLTLSEANFLFKVWKFNFKIVHDLGPLISNSRLEVKRR